MNIQFPKPLVPGDLIAITAPSSGVSPPLHPRLDLAIAQLQQHGYRVVEGACLRQQRKGSSASPQARAAELMQFLTDPSVAAVMPPWGGELAIELLGLIDFTALAAHPAKWFSGFSDLSTLHMPLTTLSGWATVHGPNLMQLAARTIDSTTAALWDVLAAPWGTPITQVPSAAFQRVGADLRADPGAGLLTSEATQWKRLDGMNTPLRLQGRLIGGCLDTLPRIAGTRYANVPQFIAHAGQEGAIVYLENTELKPFDLARALHSLRLHGWFNGVQGILLGRSAAPDAATPDAFSYLDALRSALGDLPCPVLYDLDIGHLSPQMSIVNGALATLSFAGESSTLVQHLGDTFS